MDSVGNGRSGFSQTLHGISSAHNRLGSLLANFGNDRSLVETANFKTADDWKIVYGFSV